jgi:hypothetical protein
LYKALQEHSIRDIVELEVTDRKATVQDYLINRSQIVHDDAPIVIPHINYLTNDSWEIVSGTSRTTGHPIFHYSAYGDGVFYVLTIPDNFDDMYNMPVDVWSVIRDVVTADLYVHIDGPSQVMLFVYDNDTFIVESFLTEPATVQIVVSEEVEALHDVASQQVLDEKHLLLGGRQQEPTGKVGFDVTIPPHSYRVFRIGKP